MGYVWLSFYTWKWLNAIVFLIYNSIQIKFANPDYLQTYFFYLLNNCYEILHICRGQWVHTYIWKKELKWFWKNKNVDASISIGATKRSSLKITFHLVYILFLDDSVTNLGYFQRSYSYESIPKLYQLFRLIWIKSLFKRNLLGNFCIFLSPFILHYGRTVAWWQDTNSKTGALGPRYFAKAMAKFLALLFIAKRRQMDKEDGWPI